jgi:hypothetical protein
VLQFECHPRTSAFCEVKDLGEPREVFAFFAKTTNARLARFLIQTAPLSKDATRKMAGILSRISFPNVESNLDEISLRNPLVPAPMPAEELPRETPNPTTGAEHGRSIL